MSSQEVIGSSGVVLAEFSDERFLSAAEKRLILNSWIVFLKHGCQLRNFTVRLYHHLVQHCSFIAHYNLQEFHSFYFNAPGPKTRRFLDQFDPAKPGISAELATTHWLMNVTGADLNRAMREDAAPYINRLRFHFFDAERNANVALATQLAEKWGKRLIDSSQDSASGAPRTNTEGTPAGQLAISFE